MATTANWLYGGEATMHRAILEAMNVGTLRGFIVAASVAATANSGDFETARQQLRTLRDEDFEQVRFPDGHLPASICVLAGAAALVGDQESGARLLPVLERMRGSLIVAAPGLGFGQIPEQMIGQLRLLMGEAGAAVEELRVAVARADEVEQVWASAWARVDLAKALHRSGDTEQARRVLAEAESLASQHGVGWASKWAAEARAEIEGREAPALDRFAERSKPIRALATRGGRKALAAMVRNLDDGEIERRYADPRRQRALLRATARGFQPAQAAGFRGAIAYELQPFAIEPPSDAPWRWAIEVDADAGRARLLEPAPLDPAVTIYFGLADWVRVMAGIESPLSAMVSGRCTVEGDVVIAARQEAMFGAR
jgi:hypothetical protein